jgi:hypothetical protein
MVDYSIVDGELLHTGWYITARGWVKTVPEWLSEDVDTLFQKINVNGHIRRQNCAL